jgi:hypothetical protein
MPACLSGDPEAFRESAGAVTTWTAARGCYLRRVLMFMTASVASAECARGGSHKAREGHDPGGKAPGVAGRLEQFAQIVGGSPPVRLVSRWSESGS